jgi:hypothetical protein
MTLNRKPSIHSLKTLLFIWILWSLPVGPLYAWYGQGHVRATRLAVEALDGYVPDFFIQGRETVAHCAVDPDVFKISVGSHALYSTEYPDHFFDLELFGDEHLPDTRRDFWWWCLNHRVYTNKIGTLPYAVLEWTSRLTIVLAEHRQWPQNQAIQTKCLVYAGLLAHYAQDMCMPLHTTIHYDGRVLDNGQSPHTGIHDKVDALLEKADVCDPIVFDSNDLAPFTDIHAAILAQIQASNALVDYIYDLEPQLPEVEAPLVPDSKAATFACERLYATALFTARLYVNAWEQSADVELPDWLQREDY